MRADARCHRGALITLARGAFDTADSFALRSEDFAALAGVGTGTLHRDSPTRRDLAVAVQRSELLEIEPRTRRPYAGHPPREALAGFLGETITQLHAAA